VDAGPAFVTDGFPDVGELDRVAHELVDDAPELHLGGAQHLNDSMGSMGQGVVVMLRG
jgi:hypothetical protein